MTWLRLDDGFTSHLKIVQLTDAQFRVWLKLLCYCARVGDPTVDRLVQREIPGLTPLRIATFAKLGLLDSTPKSDPESGSRSDPKSASHSAPSSSQDRHQVFEIHDWLKYLPKDATSAERQARWRARNTVTNTVTSPVTESVTPTVTAPPPPALPSPPQARARVPVPYQDQEQPPAPAPSPAEDSRDADNGARPGAGAGGLERIGETITTELAGYAVTPDYDEPPPGEEPEP